jgi:NTP pyrophosphatase (non-canonical NTP hydrolase)
VSFTIKTLVYKAYKQAKDKGFHDTECTFGDRIALVHTELSEAMEAFRELDNDAYDAIREPLYRSKQSGVLTRAESEYKLNKDGSDGLVLNKPEGVWSELADVVIRVADMCGVYGIDLEDAIIKKLAYNKTRPFMHGGKRL